MVARRLAAILAGGAIVCTIAAVPGLNEAATPLYLVTDLGTLGGSESGAMGINNRGQVVGYEGNDPAVSTQPEGRPFHAVLWEQGRMTRLDLLIPPHSGWALEKATAINDRGQIAGIGRKGGRERAFLLTPVKAAASARQSP